MLGLLNVCYKYVYCLDKIKSKMANLWSKALVAKQQEQQQPTKNPSTQI